MNERALRRQCRRELQALGVQPPLRVDDLCRLLGERRERPIRLVPHPLPVPGPFGMWLATASADYILYQQKTSKIHQDHIILHEVGHILADHQSDDTDEEFWRESMPDLSPDAVRRALRRTHYDHEHEREAELVATIILEWASVLDRVTPRRVSDPSLHRIQTALGDRRGWL
ncbi:hypothetical protein [Kitasatospora sp. NPDC056531]|uniref:hypothetical protein n=1 Tax=Kitasatospora sp. NPDC056531 TaxID=3345856 RepID=UPI0036C88EA2